MPLTKKVSTAISVAIAVSIIIIVFLIIFFGCLKRPDPIYDSFYILGSYFGGISTLAAAYIASKLFNDWKEEKNFDAKKEYAQSILVGIRDVIIQRTIILNNNVEISATDNSLIIKTNLLNHKELRILPLIHKLYIDFEAISNLTNNNLMLKFEKLELIANQIDKDYARLINLYSNYYNNYIYTVHNNKASTPLSYYDIDREYLEIVKDQLLIDITIISNFNNDNILSEEVIDYDFIGPNFQTHGLLNDLRFLYDTLTSIKSEMLKYLTPDKT